VGATETDDGGRGCADSGEDRDGAAQCVAWLAPLQLKGGPGRVGLPGKPAKLGARRRLLAGGCGNSGSSRLVAWLGPHASVQAHRVREEALGVLNWPRARAERGAHRRSTMATAAGLGRSREEGRRRPFICGREVVGRSLRTKTAGSGYGRWHG
jgi:hypothetical protein